MKKLAKKSVVKIKEFKSMKMHGEIFEVGDVVRVREYYDDESFARILKIFREVSRPDAFVKIKWLYKPSEVFPDKQSFISQYELFESDHVQDIYAQCIFEKAKVLSLEEYHAYDEVEDDVYFSRAQYRYRDKTIDPPLDAWKRVCFCKSIINPDVLYLQCDSCQQFYHVGCIKDNISETESWLCATCRTNNFSGFYSCFYIHFLILFILLSSTYIKYSYFSSNPSFSFLNSIKFNQKLPN